MMQEWVPVIEQDGKGPQPCVCDNQDEFGPKQVFFSAGYQGTLGINVRLVSAAGSY